MNRGLLRQIQGIGKNVSTLWKLHLSGFHLPLYPFLCNCDFLENSSVFRKHSKIKNLHLLSNAISSFLTPERKRWCGNNLLSLSLWLEKNPKINNREGTIIRYSRVRDYVRSSASLNFKTQYQNFLILGFNFFSSAVLCAQMFKTGVLSMYYHRQRWLLLFSPSLWLFINGHFRIVLIKF